MGEAACFLAATCLSCGRFIGDEHEDADRCSHCGTARGD